MPTNNNPSNVTDSTSLNSGGKSRRHSKKDQEKKSSAESGGIQPAVPGQVIDLKNRKEFQQRLEEAGNKLVLIEFYAPWCGPCKRLAVKLEELAKQYMEKIFIMKLDVDEIEDVAMEYKVSSMPSFMFMQKKKVLKILVGSNEENLTGDLEKYFTEGPAALIATNTATTTTASSGVPGRRQTLVRSLIKVNTPAMEPPK